MASGENPSKDLYGQLMAHLKGRQTAQSAFFRRLVTDHLCELGPLLVDEILRLTNEAKYAKHAKGLGDLHLLDGLAPIAEELPFVKRMQVAQGEKADLANYCMEQCGLCEIVEMFKADIAIRPDCKEHSSFKRIFFESGSTISYVIGKFADRLAEAKQSVQPEKLKFEPNLLRNRILTNNLLTLTALAGRAYYIQPIQGRLDAKYFGLFPFFEFEPGSNHKLCTKNEQLEEEIKSFASVRDQVHKCHQVFATCSNFSFLAGPLVGSRANALVKRAMHLGKEKWDNDSNNKYYLLFHFNKLVPFARDQLPIGEAERADSKCFRVFIDAPENIRGAFQSNKNLFAKSSWHTDWLSADVNPGPGKCALAGFDTPEAKGKPRIPGLLDPWLAAAEGTHVLVALPRAETELAFDCLSGDLMLVNKLLAAAQSGRRYRFVNSDNEITRNIPSAKSQAIVRHVVHLKYISDTSQP